MTSTIIPSAAEWFRQGRRVPFDPKSKTIVPSHSSICVFERVVKNNGTATRWLTMLPGFPDGSYGWSKVDGLLRNKDAPRLYVEYVGQGDSDKPTDYHYSTMECADLVEAQWRAHNVKRTVVVTFDYSSLVLMELLQRQTRRQTKSFTNIEHVLIINGGLFVDGHSHPISTTPLLQTYAGRMMTWLAQRNSVVFRSMVRPLFSQDYKVTMEELNEMNKATTRRNGAVFMSLAAGFVKEHQQRQRWDFETIFHEHHSAVTFHLVGSKEDPFEWKQLGLARERLQDYVDSGELSIRSIPGGHMSTSEQAHVLARWIDAILRD